MLAAWTSAISPMCALSGRQRTCWSHSHWDPFSSGSVTPTWATHSPTSKAWARGQGRGRRALGLPWRGQGLLHTTTSQRAASVKFWRKSVQLPLWLSPVALGLMVTETLRLRTGAAGGLRVSGCCPSSHHPSPFQHLLGNCLAPPRRTC